MAFPVVQKLAVGDRVYAMSSGWLGTIIKKNKQKSSPWKVKWDKNGRESNVNCMVVRKCENETSCSDVRENKKEEESHHD
jgi:preprotein translocase subunit YajC